MPKMVAEDIQDYFLMCQPVAGVSVYEASNGQENVEYFGRRLNNDLAPIRPTVALTCFDFGNGREGAGARSLTFYEPTYLAGAITNLKKLGVREIVVGSSYASDSTNAGSATFNQNLGLFRDVQRDVAAKNGARFADLLTPMLAAMPLAKAAYGDGYVFGGDGSGRTPVASGQLIMAYAYLKALGCDGAIGTISVDLAANTATGTDGQKIVSFQDGTVAVESTRYPFCFLGDPKLAQSTGGVAAAGQFNDELNRYVLVVKGLRSSRAKVTWGSQSRDFDAADLAKGVNLAAAFAGHTPFDATFAKVDNAVWDRQNRHNAYNTLYFHTVGDLKTMAPTEVAAVDKLGDAILAQDRALNASCAALVVPVTHTLKIEAINDVPK
jgi:hypothetical protein